MKPGIIVVAGAAMLAACAASPETSQSLRHEVETGLRPPVVVSGDDLAKFSLERRQADYGVPAASVAIARNGQLSWVGAYGDGVDQTTKYQVASLSKAVAAVGILRLAAEYGIDLDENISPRFTSIDADEIAPRGVSITLRGLLSHTAGVVPTDFAGYARGTALPENAQLIRGELPASSKAIVIMANSEAAYPFIFEVLRGASEAHGWPGTPVRYVTLVAVPREKLETYAGVYRMPNREKRVFTLFVQDGELRGLNASDQAFSMLAISEDVFISPSDGQEIRFVTDGDGVSAKIGDRLFPKRPDSPGGVR